MPTPECKAETAFLRHVISYDDTAERQELDSQIAQAQREAQCVRRAVLVMTLVAVVAGVSLGYAAVLFPHHPLDLSRFFSHPFVDLLLALALAALCSALAFLVLEVVYRKRLEARREECRQFAARVIESRLGQPTARSTRSIRGENNIHESLQTSGTATPDSISPRSRPALRA